MPKQLDLVHLRREVIDRLPEECREVLMRTSIVRETGPSLAQALTGRTEAAAILHRLAAEYDLLTALDPREPGGPVLYRHHPLIRELLRSEFGERTERRGIEAVHLAACDWYRRNGRLLEAARQAVAGGRHRLGLKLVRSVGYRLCVERPGPRRAGRPGVRAGPPVGGRRPRGPARRRGPDRGRPWHGRLAATAAGGGAVRAGVREAGVGDGADRLLPHGRRPVPRARGGEPVPCPGGGGAPLPAGPALPVGRRHPGRPLPAVLRRVPVVERTGRRGSRDPAARRGPRPSARASSSRRCTAGSWPSGWTSGRGGPGATTAARELLRTVESRGWAHQQPLCAVYLAAGWWARGGGTNSPRPGPCCAPSAPRPDGRGTGRCWNPACWRANSSWRKAIRTGPATASPRSATAWSGTNRRWPTVPVCWRRSAAPPWAWASSTRYGPGCAARTSARPRPPG
ncbi:hypothetical protein [Streptomyces thioluteus]|uniref:hypothetical protein n=1 Tax=Streptomyces thioluteus TaxID=66431 RepID=UPI0031EBD18B